MPPKRSSLLDNPPDASSSSEDVEEEEEPEEAEEEEAEEDEEEDEHEQVSAKRSSAKNPTIKSTPTSNAVSGRQAHRPSDDEEEEDEEFDSQEESGSDSEPSPEKPRQTARGADPSIKPITSKPMDDIPKPKKPPTKPGSSPIPALNSPTRSTTTVKRPVETDKEGNRDPKSKKKKVSDADENGSLQGEETEKKPGDDAKKQLFQRLWSEDDEIIILKGIMDYSKKGTDPWTDMAGFHEFIKKSLHVDVNKNQLADKIRRLRKKYKTNVGRGKGGQDPLFSKSHESKAFELSKKIWGFEDNAGGNNQATDDGKKGKKQKAENAVGSAQVKVPSSGEAPNAAAKADEELNCSMYPCLMESFRLGKITELARPDFGEGIVKEGLGLMGSSKVKELEERWRKLHMAEIEMHLKRVDLFRDQLKMLFDALGSKK
ncbi:PREDICTED: STOREKEEPER protein-like [Nelumbo nucifera]|uniref:STOREKEEPER protein-like n=1 Tax=Nelumbo nucifera TaxID=4432 RepID=A0A1U8BG50_NELNU|nr:PREDICTED: STOREKEEPER protein-like [Nelumbo nucifera]